MSKLARGMCQHHTPGGPEGYVEKSAWGMARIKKGERQKQCKQCRYWFFPEEMGTK